MKRHVISKTDEEYIVELNLTAYELIQALEGNRTYLPEEGDVKSVSFGSNWNKGEGLGAEDFLNMKRWRDKVTVVYTIKKEYV